MQVQPKSQQNIFFLLKIENINYLESIKITYGQKEEWFRKQDEINKAKLSENVFGFHLQIDLKQKIERFDFRIFIQCQENSTYDESGKESIKRQFTMAEPIFLFKTYFYCQSNSSKNFIDNFVENHLDYYTIFLQKEIQNSEEKFKALLIQYFEFVGKELQFEQSNQQKYDIFPMNQKKESYSKKADIKSDTLKQLLPYFEQLLPVINFLDIFKVKDIEWEVLKHYEFFTKGLEQSISKLQENNQNQLLDQILTSMKEKLDPTLKGYLLIFIHILCNDKGEKNPIFYQLSQPQDETHTFLIIYLLWSYIEELHLTLSQDVIEKLYLKALEKLENSSDLKRFSEDQKYQFVSLYISSGLQTAESEQRVNLLIKAFDLLMQIDKKLFQALFVKHFVGKDVDHLILSVEQLSKMNMIQIFQSFDKEQLLNQMKQTLKEQNINGQGQNKESLDKQKGNYLKVIQAIYLLDSDSNKYLTQSLIRVFFEQFPRDNIQFIATSLVNQEKYDELLNKEISVNYVQWVTSECKKEKSVIINKVESQLDELVKIVKSNLLKEISKLVLDDLFSEVKKNFVEQNESKCWIDEDFIDPLLKCQNTIFMGQVIIYLQDLFSKLINQENGKEEQLFDKLREKKKQYKTAGQQQAEQIISQIFVSGLQVVLGDKDDKTIKQLLLEKSHFYLIDAYDSCDNKIPKYVQALETLQKNFVQKRFLYCEYQAIMEKEQASGQNLRLEKNAKMQYTNIKNFIQGFEVIRSIFMEKANFKIKFDATFPEPYTSSELSDVEEILMRFNITQDLLNKFKLVSQSNIIKKCISQEACDSLEAVPKVVEQMQKKVQALFQTNQPTIIDFQKVFGQNEFELDDWKSLPQQIQEFVDINKDSELFANFKTACFIYGQHKPKDKLFAKGFYNIITFIKKNKTGKIDDFEKIQSELVKYLKFDENTKLKDLAAHQEELNKLQTQIKDELKKSSQIKHIDDAYQQIESLITFFPEETSALFQYLDDNQITIQDLQSIREYLNDEDGSDLSIQITLRAISIKELFEKLKEIPGQKELKIVDLVQLLSQFMDINFKDFQQQQDGFQQIKDMKLTMQSELAQRKRKQILQITKQSEVIFDFSDQLFDFQWQVKIYFGDKVKVTSTGIIDLRDNAFYIMKLLEQESKGESNSDILKNLEKFVDMVSVIQSCLQNLMALYDQGYRNHQFLLKNKSYFVIEGTFHELCSLRDELAHEYQDWQNFIDEIYSKNYLICFCNPKNLLFLESYVLKEEQDDYKNKIAVSLLRQMGIQREDISFPAEFINEQVPKNRIQNLSDALNQKAEHLQTFSNSEKLQIQNLCHKTPSLQQSQLVQSFSQENLKQTKNYFIESKNLIQSILTIFSKYGHTYPRIDQVYFCTDQSKWSDIQLFMYRCKNNQRREQYCLINLDRLPVKIQNCFILFAQENGSIYFGLLNFIMQSDRSKISNFIKRFFPVNLIRSTEFKQKQEIQQIFEQQQMAIKIYYSKEAGLGKSFAIEQYAIQQNKKLIWFPIFGTLNAFEIGKRLLHIDYEKESILAIVLSPLSDQQSLNQIVTNLSLFKAFVLESFSLLIPERFEIIIELQNSIPDRYSIELFDFAPDKNKHFIDKFEKINLSNEQVSDHYLKVKNYINDYKTVLKIEEPVDVYLKLQFETMVTNLQQNLNYYRFQTFIKVLSTLIECYGKGAWGSEDLIKQRCDEFKQQIRIKEAKEYQAIRSHFWQEFLKTASECNLKSINGSQDGTEKVNSWNQRNHLYLILVTDGTPLFLYQQLELVPEFFKKQLEIENDYKSKNKKNQQQDWKEKLKILKTHQIPVEEEATEYYQVTRDNYIKICFIYQKVVAQLPVVIMGETGCGKTSLIKYLSQFLLQDHLEVVSIHAGTTTSDIVDKINNFKNLKLGYEKQRLWIFFDEFNTTPDLQLICEIITQRTMYGELLPKNMIFIGACNPFHKNYLVQRLPETIKEYIWDFGSLKQQDYIEYIGALIEQDKKSRERKQQQEQDKKQKNYNMLYTASNEEQQHLQGIIAKCIELFHDLNVSLRDVARFIQLRNWFEESLISRQQLQGKMDFSKLNKKEIWIRAVVLATYLCFFLKLEDVSLRKSNMINLCGIEDSKKLNLKTDQILKIVEEEQNDYISRMNLDPELIAINQALRENIFGLIPCIVNKIPVLLHGKPGSSKSLAVQLIYSCLQGKQSKDAYFRTIKKVTLFSFQGSNSCTSQGISQVFERAKNFQEDQKETYNVVFLFDEIGLAELSKHNPLKILHNYLEIENQIISFIGISNSKLDAAKMNRVLQISRPDPEEQDLKETAQQLNCKLKAKQEILNSIVTFYSKTLENLKLEFKGTPTYQNFYGLRDFYHCIKYFKSKEATAEVWGSVFYKGLLRNFSGSKEIFPKVWNQQTKQQLKFDGLQAPNTLSLVDENLQEQNARYLLLTGRSDIAFTLIENLLKKKNHPYRIFIGSQLENDLSRDEYYLTLLKNIIICAENGIIAILNDVQYIESSLYNLFNQSFSKIGDEKYCRISLGEYRNPICRISNSFKCVMVFNDETALKQKDPPLLNRFEKHVVEYKDLLDQKQLEIFNDCTQWIKNFTLGQDCSQCIKYIFPTHSEEFLALQILSKSQVGYSNFSKEELIKIIKKELLKLATPDLLIALEVSKGFPEEAKLIIKKEYDECQQLLVSELINCQVETNKRENLGIITFSDEGEIEEFFKEIQNYSRQHCEYFKAEAEIIQELHSFLQNPKLSVIFLELDFIESYHLINYFQNLILNFQNDQVRKIEQLKTFVLLIKMKRTTTNLCMPFSINWKYLVRYHLKKQQEEVYSTYSKLSNDQMMDEKKTSFNIHSLIDMDSCVQSFRFPNVDYQLISQVIEKYKDLLKKDTTFQGIINKKVLQLFKNQSIVDWRISVFAQNDSQDLSSAITKVLSNLVAEPLRQLLYFLFQNSAAQTYSLKVDETNMDETNMDKTNMDKTNMEAINQFKNRIWLQHVEGWVTNQKIELQPIQGNTDVETDLEIVFPFIIQDFGLLISPEEQEQEDDFSRFKRMFLEQSILKVTNAKDIQGKANEDKPYQLFLDQEALQEQYLYDILRLFLRNKLCIVEKAQLSFASECLRHLFWLASKKDLLLSLFKFRNSQPILSQFCYIILIWQELCNKYLKRDEHEIIKWIQDESESEDKKQVMKQVVQQMAKFIKLNPFIQVNESDSFQLSAFYERIYYLIRIFNQGLSEKIKGLDIIKLQIEILKCLSQTEKNLRIQFIQSLEKQLKLLYQKGKVTDEDIIGDQEYFSLVTKLANPTELQIQSPNYSVQLSSQIFETFVVLKPKDLQLLLDQPKESQQQERIDKFDHFQNVLHYSQAFLFKFYRKLASESEILLKKEMDDNEYLIEFERFIDKFKDESSNLKFKILNSLSQFLQNELADHFNELKKQYNLQWDKPQNEFKDFVIKFKKQDFKKNFDEVRTLTILKLYIRLYVESLNLPNEVSVEFNEGSKEQKNLEDKLEDLKFYACKVLYKTLKLKKKNYIDQIKAMEDYEWIKDLIQKFKQESNGDTKYNLFFTIAEVEEQMHYQFLCLIFCTEDIQNKKRNHKLKKFINQMSGSQYALGIQFQNIFYTIHLIREKEPKMFNFLTNLYKQKISTLIKDQYSHQFEYLLEQLVNNFPIWKFLSLKPDSKKENTNIEYEELIILTQILIVFYSDYQYKAELFFNNSLQDNQGVKPQEQKFQNPIQIIKNQFYLKIQQSMKTIDPQNLYYECKKNELCGFIFCFEPSQKQLICPWCRSAYNTQDLIGKTIKSPEIDEHLKTVLNAIQQTKPSPSVELDKQLSVLEAIHKLAQKLLLAYQSTTPWKNDKTSEQDKQENDIKEEIQNLKKSLSDLKEQFNSQKEQKIDLQLGLVSRLISDLFILKPNYIDEYLQISKQLPKKIEEIKYNVNKLNQNLSFYTRLREFNEPKSLYSQLTQITVDPSWKDLQKFLNLRTNTSLIVEVYLKNIESINQLRIYYPFYSFIQELLQTYDFQITRDQAKSMKLSEALKENDNQKKYDEFKNEIQDIQAKCPIINQLQSLLNPELTLINFLPDSREQAGQKIREALQHFAKYQNGILSEIQQEYLKSRNLQNNQLFDQRRNEPHLIKPDHIIACDFDFLQFYYQCLDYGFCNQNIYDLGALELRLMDNLIKKRYIDEDKFRCIQFQFEIQRSSDIFLTIKKHLPQEKIKIDDEKELERCFQNQRTEIRSKMMSQIKKLLHQIAHSREDQETSLFKICEKEVRFYKDLVDLKNKNKKVEELKLKNLLHLYQILERSCFDQILEQVHPDYKKPFQDEIATKEQINQWLGEEKKTKVDCLQIAYQRFISRDLQGKLHKDAKQSEYINIENTELWDFDPENTNEWLRKMLSNYPPLKIENIQATYKIVTSLLIPIEKIPKSTIKSKKGPGRVD